MFGFGYFSQTAFFKITLDLIYPVYESIRQLVQWLHFNTDALESSFRISFYADNKSHYSNHFNLKICNGISL